MPHHKFISSPHIFKILRVRYQITIQAMVQEERKLREKFLWGNAEIMRVTIMLICKIKFNIYVFAKYVKIKRFWSWKCLIFIVFFFKIIHNCLILVLKNASYWPHIWGIFTYGVALTTLLFRLGWLAAAAAVALTSFREQVYSFMVYP